MLRLLQESSSEDDEEAPPPRCTVPAMFVGGEKAAAGTLTLTPSELQWHGEAELAPAVRVALARLNSVVVERKQATPFMAVNVLSLHWKDRAAPLIFHLRAQLADAQAFKRAVDSASAATASAATASAVCVCVLFFAHFFFAGLRPAPRWGYRPRPRIFHFSQYQQFLVHLLGASTTDGRTWPQRIKSSPHSYFSLVLGVFVFFVYSFSSEPCYEGVYILWLEAAQASPVHSFSEGSVPGPMSHFFIVLR